MFKKSLIISILAMFIFSSFSAIAASKFDGNKRKGKYLLRKIYKACKKRGEVDSATPKISPADKTQAQWETNYALVKTKAKSKEYNELMKLFKCQPEWEKAKDKALLDIFTYMYEHASDSSTPAKCK
jgi:hypothetical protein